MGFEQVNDAVEFEAAFDIPGNDSDDVFWCVADGIAIGNAIDNALYFGGEFVIEIRMLEVTQRLKSFDLFEMRCQVVGEDLFRFVQGLMGHRLSHNWRDVVASEWARVIDGSKKPENCNTKEHGHIETGFGQSAGDINTCGDAEGIAKGCAKVE